MAQRNRRTSRLLIILVLAFVLVLIVWGEFTFQGAPVTLPTSPIVAFRIVGNESDSRLYRDDPDTLHGYSIVQKTVSAGPQMRRDVLNLLGSHFVYGTLDAMCFEPGIAIRMGEGANTVDALVCLDCEHVDFYYGSEVSARNLNEIGVSRFKSLYPRLFPGHTVDGPNEDASRTAAARDEETKRREERMSSTAPTSQP